MRCYLAGMSKINVQNISHSYGKVKALDRLSFSVDEDEIFGLIGPDGAGKSTLFKILTTLLLADEGEAHIMGLDVRGDFRAIRNRIGYMPGKFSLYLDLSVAENLEFFATVFGTTVEDNMDIIHDIYVQLEPFKIRLAGKLSGGMKQKLALCCALIHRPDVLFLDEPTTGVDPVSRKEFWQMLKKLKGMGIAILVSTPYMDEAALCDRVALMQGGKILSIETPAQISSSYPYQLLAMRASEMYALLKQLRTMSEVKSSYTFGDFIHVGIEKGANAQNLLANLKEAGFDVESKPIEAGIENVFMQLLKQKDEA